MKLATIAAILGVATAIDIRQSVEEPEENLVQEYDGELEELIDQDIDTADSEELIDAEENAEEDAEEGEDAQKRICKTFYELKKPSKPTSFGTRKIPRCVVGTT